MESWLESAPGRYLLDWEQGFLDAAVADVFGFHAIQLGMGALDGLRANRMPHRWWVAPPGAPAKTRRPDLLCDLAALAFDSSCIDLVVLPHSLELHADPHAALREVERVLVPEGKVVITGFNPASLWGWRQWRGHLYRKLGVGSLYLPEVGEFLALRRLRDWLRLLNFEVEMQRLGCYRPALRSDAALSRTAWLDRAGSRWWPFAGAVYGLLGTKRVPGMRLIDPGWKRQPVLLASRAAATPMQSPLAASTDTYSHHE